MGILLLLLPQRICWDWYLRLQRWTLWSMYRGRNWGVEKENERF